MENAWKEVQPKNIYRVQKQIPLRDHGKESLAQLYQPIIGTDAFCVYFSLLGDILWQYGMSESMLHSDILTDCNISIQQFYEARLKLEGIGLLSVYRKQDAELGSVFLYQLHDPLSPVAFLKDSLLIFLLKERVSENKFKTLIKRFEPKEIDTTDYQDVTRTFNEVYGFQQERFAVTYDELADYTKTFDVSEEHPLKTPKDDLDWQLLKECLDKLGVRSELSEDERENIFLSHAMYGLDELELSELLAKTADATEGKIELKTFKKAVRQLFQQKKAVKFSEPEKRSGLDAEESRTYRFNSLKLEGFSEYDIQIIKEAEEFAPIVYCQAIKEQKGSYMTKKEEWGIEGVIRNSKLPNSVINILIHFILVAKDYPVMNEDYMNKKAIELAEKKVHTPDAALKYLRDQESKPKSTAKPEKNPYQRKVRREKVPEWMNKKSVPEAKLSPERQAELDEKLKEFLKEGDR